MRILAFVLGTLFVAVLLLVGVRVWAVRSMRADLAKASDRLVAEVAAVDREPRARPTHVVPPLPGAFGDAAMPLLERLPDEFEHPMKLPAAREANFPIEEPVLRGLLAATHAETAKAPADILRQVSLLPILHVFREAIEAARAEQLAGHTGPAQQTCLDALGLARDVLQQGALNKGLLGLAGTLDGCGDVLAHPDEATRAALARVRLGMPTLADAAYREALDDEVAACGMHLSAAQIAGLPTVLRARATRASEEARQFAAEYMVLMLGDDMITACMDFAERRVGIIEALRASSIAARDPILERVSAASYARAGLPNRPGHLEAWVAAARDADNRYRALLGRLDRMAVAPSN